MKYNPGILLIFNSVKYHFCEHCEYFFFEQYLNMKFAARLTTSLAQLNAAVKLEKLMA